MPFDFDINVNSFYFSRFFFHYNLDVLLGLAGASLELKLVSKLEPEKRNVFSYSFQEEGTRVLVDKIPLTGLSAGIYDFSLRLSSTRDKDLVIFREYPVELIPEVDPMMDYLYDFHLLSSTLSNKKGANIRALLKNLGQSSWGIDSSPLSVSLKYIKENTEHDFPVSEHVILGRGEVMELNLKSDQVPNEKGIYELLINLKLGEQELPFSREDESAYLAYFYGTSSKEEVKIQVSKYELRGGRYLLIKGRVENTGEVDWYMDPDVKNPVLLGFKIRQEKTQSSEAIEEFRFRPEVPWVKSGDGFDFEVSYELKNIFLNKFIVSVDMLVEGSHWFREYEDHSCEIEIDPRKRQAENSSKEESSTKSIKNINSILLVSPSLPLYDREAGGMRLLEIIKCFRSNGARVVFFYENTGIAADHTPYLKALEDLGVEHCSDLKGVLFNTEFSPDMVYISTWGCIEKYVESLRESFKDALLVGDMIDLHWKREERAFAQGILTDGEKDLLERKEREKRAYLSCDKVIVVTEDDRKNLLEECPGLSVLVISTIHRLREICFNQASLESLKALFIGHFRHLPNVSACMEAVRVVKEFNKNSERKLQLDIIGDNAPEEILKLDDKEEIFVRGFVPDLSEYEKKASFFLAPITYGAGIKGKICEAIAAGLPVITSELGNEGIGLVHKKEGIIAGDLKEYIEGINYLISDSDRTLELVKNARGRLENLFSIEAVRPVISNLTKPRPVTIAIVTYNQMGLLAKCLKSVFELSKYPDFEVVVVSNACEDATEALLKEFKIRYGAKFSYSLNEENEYFIRPNNWIISNSGDRDIILLNNDTEIIDANWISELNSAAYMAPWVGASGCMNIGIDGKILEAGAKMNKDGRGENLGRGQGADNPLYNELKYVDYVSGCCLYMKRCSINLVGALDEDFHPMYYEDAYWQFLLREKGLKTVYTPRTKIIHKEGSSAGTDLSQGMKKYQAINREKYVRKCESYGNSKK